VAGSLSAIPVAGLFFITTDLIGRALWAADLEKCGKAPKTVGK
jgi:hypothetical protein